jgi:hypothetical protein
LAVLLTIAVVAAAPWAAVGRQVKARAQDRHVAQEGVAPFDRWRLDNIYRQIQSER